MVHIHRIFAHHQQQAAVVTVTSWIPKTLVESNDQKPRGKILKKKQSHIFSKVTLLVAFFWYLSIYLYIYLSIYLSTYLPIHPCIHPSIHPFIHPSIHPSIYPFIYLYGPTKNPPRNLSVDRLFGPRERKPLLVTRSVIRPARAGGTFPTPGGRP